jgi:hypothetical protein
VIIMPLSAAEIAADLSAMVANLQPTVVQDAL